MTRNLPDVSAPGREIRVPWATLGKLFAAGIAAWAILQLRMPLAVFLLASLIAIALSPLVDRLERAGVSRGWAVSLLAIGMILVLAGLVALVVPPLTTEMSELWRSLPKLHKSLSQQMDHAGLGSRILLPVLDLPLSPEFEAWLSRPLAWGPAAMESLAGAFLILVLALYLLLDGKKVVAWLLAYVPRSQRGRMSDTVPELFQVMQAYTTGQLIMSVLFSVFTFVVLTILGVPAALPLALFAGACDVVPVAGIFAATGAAAFCALTVRPAAAVIVVGVFLAYHVFEAYFLMPRLYGNRLRLSTLTVLLAILAGAALGGIVGAVLALPLVAAYPIIEKHWLGFYLHPDAVEDHAALRETDDKGEHAAAVDAVIRGEPQEQTP